MKYVWQDLPERKNCFTVRNAAMINLNTNKIIRNYSANTKIVVVQKCVTPGKTYYRTQEAAHHYLNYAFEAAAFGLPNEIAPSAHNSNSLSRKKNLRTTERKKQKTAKTSKTVSQAKDGELKHIGGWLKKLLRRLYG